MTDHYEALARVEDDTHNDRDIVRVETSALAVVSRSEVEMQISAAHRYPRSIKSFLSEAITLSTLTRQVAESCIYALPRGGKSIAGPSVRLAEICASAYGNLHVAARVLDAEEREVIAQGVAHDLEKNLRVTVEARRRITGKNGRRYDDDMITMTGNAAASIALRNAIFRVIPRAYIDTVYAEVRKVAVGSASTLEARRAEVVNRLMKLGVPKERIFPRVGVAAIEDVGLDELEVLIGLGTAIKNGDSQIDVAFPPPPGPSPETKALEAELRARAAQQQQPAPSEAAQTTREEAVAAAAEMAKEPLPSWATAPVDPRAQPQPATTKTRAPRAPKQTDPAPPPMHRGEPTDGEPPPDWQPSGEREPGEEG